ncbi:hypothetical protein CI793_12810 [Anoxybacillus ayderensis]|nr:hypothetical protein CI793_12810 [Anoxybacillus ayderensis]
MDDIYWKKKSFFSRSSFGKEGEKRRRRIIERSREKGSRGEKNKREEAGEIIHSSLFLFPKIEIKWDDCKEKIGKKTEKKSQKSGEE